MGSRWHEAAARVAGSVRVPFAEKGQVTGVWSALRRRFRVGIFAVPPLAGRGAIP